MKAADRDAAALEVANRQQWRSWLAQNHATARGIWLIVNRKHSSRPGVSLAEAVEEALCFGWIDSTLRPVDSECYTLYMAPRRPRSVWSRANQQRVARLIELGMMMPAGMRVVKQAQRDGSWRQLDEVEELAIPGDLELALAANETAESNFAAFSASNKKMLLWWIASARRAETRARRIEEAVAMAADNIPPAEYWQ